MGIAVRDWAVADYRAVLKALVEAQELHAGMRPDVYAKGAQPMSKEEFLEAMADASNICLAAEFGGQFAGELLGYIAEPAGNLIVKDRRVLRVQSLSVLSEYRRRGVGSALFAGAIERAAAHGARAIELNVLSFNEGAIAFYTKLGMKAKAFAMELDIEEGRR